MSTVTLHLGPFTFVGKEIKANERAPPQQINYLQPLEAAATAILPSLLETGNAVEVVLDTDTKDPTPRLVYKSKDTGASGIAAVALELVRIAEAEAYITHSQYKDLLGGNFGTPRLLETLLTFEKSWLPILQKDGQSGAIAVIEEMNILLTRATFIGRTATASLADYLLMPVVAPILMKDPKLASRNLQVARWCDGLLRATPQGRLLGRRMNIPCLRVNALQQSARTFSTEAIAAAAPAAPAAAPKPAAAAALKSAAKPTSKPTAAPSATSGVPDELAREIEAQGTKIRELKAAKADPATIKAEVAVLLKLKEQAGVDPKAGSKREQEREARKKGKDGEKKAKDGKKSGTGSGGDSDLPPVTRIHFKIGKIVEIDRHPDADSLYVEKIDLGEETGPRTIISGLVKYIPKEHLLDRMVCVVANLKPVAMRGIKSYGMVLCASNDDKSKIEVLQVPSDAKIGDRVEVTGLASQGTPDEELKPKKKVWESVQPDLNTNDSLEATWKGQLMVVGASKQPLTAATLKGGNIS
eukprot:Clim_evm12s158 gene=Clim_evmTU12s158